MPESMKVADRFYMQDHSSDIKEIGLKPSYVWLNVDKLQDDPVSDLLSKKSGRMKAVILERYDDERLLICLVNTVYRQVILVLESRLEAFDG